MGHEHALFAERIFDIAHADVSNPPDMGDLAEALLGDCCLGFAVTHGKPWCLQRRSRDAWRVCFRRELSREDSAYAVACGLVAWAVDRGIIPPVSGRGLLDVAGHLLLPRGLLDQCVEDNWSVEEIASAHVCPVKVVRSRMREDRPALRRSGEFTLSHRLGFAG